jgi:Flp pilus assembly pilin Flp
MHQHRLRDRGGSTVEHALLLAFVAVIAAATGTVAQSFIGLIPASLP